MKDLGPEPRETDYKTLESAAELEAWIGGLDADAPLAVAAGDMMGQALLGFSCKECEAPLEPGLCRAWLCQRARR